MEKFQCPPPKKKKNSVSVLFTSEFLILFPDLQSIPITSIAPNYVSHVLITGIYQSSPVDISVPITAQSSAHLSHVLIYTAHPPSQQYVSYHLSSECHTSYHMTLAYHPRITPHLDTHIAQFSTYTKIRLVSWTDLVNPACPTQTFLK